MKLLLNVVVAIASRPVLPIPGSSILMFALNAILFIPVNKRCWILRVVLTNSAVSMACHNDLILDYLSHKNALIGRFFIFGVFSIFSPFCYSVSNQPSSCVSAYFGENVAIAYVIDGDTVVLADNRHIRLIGINTPEISHNNELSDVGAEIARESLIQILDNQPQVQLLYGKERLDRHGRTLAHIYLDSGMNVQAEMLIKGLAMPLRIPPNLSLMDCYSTASLIAKKEGRGLWALPRYQTHDVFSLTGTERGFYFISGKVKLVTESRSSIWINLENNVALRIVRDDLDNFNKSDLTSLRGKYIEANGWLYKRKGQLRMRIRHKLDLNVLIN